MTDNKLLKLKTSLGDTINEWMNKQAQTDEWEALDTHVSDFLPELMTDAAFAVLMAQSNLTEYYNREDMLK